MDKAALRPLYEWSADGNVGIFVGVLEKRMNAARMSASCRRCIHSIVTDSTRPTMRRILREEDALGFQQ